jgi:hypothetical protein
LGFSVVASGAGGRNNLRSATGTKRASKGPAPGNAGR